MEWYWPWKKRPEPQRPPKVGGTRAPDQVMAIDFTKPHDFHFALGPMRQIPAVFSGCILVGFTQPMDSVKSDFERFAEYAHTRWLVLKRPDGRIAYVPRDHLLYIEESSSKETE